MAELFGRRRRRLAAAAAARCTCSTCEHGCSAATASSAASCRRRPVPRWPSTTAAPGPDAEAVICLLGDGTTNIGAFHESLNLAALWKLPIVYVIVNNQPRHGHPGRQGRRPSRTCTSAAAAYRIPGERVDGNDVARRARGGPRPAARGPRRTSARAAGGDQLPAARALRGRPGQVPLPEETERLRGLDPLPAFGPG